MSTNQVFSAEVPQNISIKLLSQFSGIKLDGYTRHVASVMCKNLKLGLQGQRLVNSALSNLPYFPTPDERLNFGWDPQHVLQSSNFHKHGYEHIAILSALAESFHSSWAAEICHEWAKSIAAPGESLPHLTQWATMLEACNGLFSSTEFPVTVEDFIRLDPYSLNFGAMNNSRLPMNVKQIVTALHALTAVVQGKQKQLTLTGSPVLGWFAAIAESLYDLNVAVFSSEGESLADTKSGEEPHLRIVYREKLGVEILANPDPEGLVHTISNLSLNITSQQYARSRHETPFGGRVVWSNLLPRVFGSSYSILEHSSNKAFAGMLGAGARMFEGLAHNETGDADTDLISAQNKANPSSYGAGLLATLCNWLPELRRYQARMERALKLDYPAAGASYVENITALREACHCGVCFSKPGDKNEGQGPDHGYCLVVQTEAILALGLALSRITVAAAIYPARAGVQGLYAAQVAKRLEARGRKWQDHFRLIYGNEWGAPGPRRLQTIAALFSGSWPTGDLPGNLVALSHEGVLAYFLKLGKGTPREDEEAVIRVWRGGITGGVKVYRRGCLGPVEGGVGDLWEDVGVGFFEGQGGFYCK